MDIATLRGEIVAADARAAFDLLVAEFGGDTAFRLEPHAKGYLNSLRIWRGDDCCLAAIPNDEWVLAYVRKPELRRGRLSPAMVAAEFPESRLTNGGEVTLRIRDAATAARWIGMIRAAG